jgi:heme A synthase
MTGMIWALLGVPLLIFIYFHRGWGWLFGVYCAVNLAFSFSNPVQRAELNKPVSASVVLIGLGLVAILLGNAAVHTLDNPLLPIVGIVTILGLIAFSIIWRNKTTAKRQEILKDL